MPYAQRLGLSQDDAHVVVERPARAVGARAVITGSARYTTDITAPGMLFGRMLYTEHPSARLIDLDVEAARRIDGVHAVLTATDVPGENSFDLYDTDQPLLIEVGDCARYQGDSVAIVAAETEEAAQQAIDAIRVTYEPLEGVHDPIVAARPGTPRVWPDRSNIYHHLPIERGDVEDGFRRADVIIERTYRTQCMEQAFLEPEGAFVVPTDDGLEVYAGCQAPHRDRRQIARSLGVPETAVRVIVPYVGGAFGGKDETHVQIHAALLAQATDRPVRLVRTREESLLTHVKRHPIVVRYRTGATNEGLLTAIEVEAHGDGGPYANMTRQVMEVFAIHASGPYYVPASRVQAYSVLTNNPAAGAMRGFGMPQAHFACEQQMDLLARRLDLDPVRIRELNAIETGGKLATGVTAVDASGMRASLHEAADMIGWCDRAGRNAEDPPHLRRGFGIASTMQGYLLGPKVRDDAAFATLELNVDGSIVLRIGIVDYGQGAHTVLAQIAAEAVGTELSDVRVIGPDTDKTLEAGSACSSRVTHMCGHAVLRAAAPVREALLSTAAELLRRPARELRLELGQVYDAAGNSRLSLAELAAATRAAGRRLAATGHYAAVSEYPDVFDKDVFDNPCAYYTFGAKAVEVVVDVETGEVVVERMCLALDAGLVLNPEGAMGQAEGGAGQGYGYSVMEELVIDEGRTQNLSLEAYLIPTARDMPATEVRFIDSVDRYGPYGARGLAELPVVPTAPAIANAVRDAVGVDCLELPMTAERVIKLIEADGVAATAKEQSDAETRVMSA